MKTRILRDGFLRFYTFLASFLFLLTTVYAESHSLQYHITGVSNPVGLPAYSIKLYIDNLEVANYNDETQIFQSSLKGRVNADHWIDLTPACRHYERVQKEHINYVNSVLDQSHGEYVFQQKVVCTLDDNGKKSGYMEYAHNGKEFIGFDKEKILYTPLSLQAESIIPFFNKQTTKCLGFKLLIENECPGVLQRLLKYASYELEKKVRPEVKVWGRPQSDGVMRLQCLAYGFYPRLVDVKWVRNGTDQLLTDEMTPVLPHPDGTYQIRVSVEVPTKEGDSYSCHVDHSSLEETLTVQWVLSDPENGFPVAVIATVVSILVVVCGVIGVLFYWKKKRAARGGSGSDANFDASSYQSAPVSESPSLCDNKL